MLQLGVFSRKFPDLFPGLIVTDWRELVDLWLS